VATVIGREELRQALQAWLPSSRRRRSSLPVEAVKVWPGRHAARPPAGQPGPDPWARAQQELDRQLAAFAGIEKRMAQAAIRDGLTEDGPLVPTLQALRLCIDSLREMTRISSQIPNHYVGQILDALATSRAVAEAETDRFRAEIEHTEADIVHRIAHSIAQSADKALARRVRVFDRNTALAAAVILVMTAVSCLGSGYWWGSRDVSTGIHQTEWRLQAAFAHGGLGASLWALLMQANDINAAIQQCHGPNLIQTGTARSACLVPLWTSLADEPPPQPQPDSTAGLLTVTPVSPTAAPDATAQREPQTIPLFAPLKPPTGPVHFGPQGSR
jgi:hypothetical protein